MESAPSPSRRFRWGLLAALAGYAFFLAYNYAPVAAGADASGYMHSARLFASGRLTMPMRTMPELTVSESIHTTPLGFQEHRFPGRLEPTYPSGLPLHIALASLVFGLKWGTLLIGVGGAVAAVALCYLLARELDISPALAAGGAVALGFCPAFLFTSLVPFSDTLATAWCLAAYLAALRARRDWRWAVAGGFACAVAVLIRPTCIVALLPLPLLLHSWRTVAGVGLGGLPGAVWLLFYQHHLYGHALQSGYGPISTAFLWECFRPSMVNYGTWLPRVLPVAFLAVLLALFAPWRERGRDLAALWLWFAVLTLFYAFYDHSQQAWWYLRFILPGFPALVVLAMLGLEHGIRRRAGARRAMVTTWCAILVALTPATVFARWERELHVMLLPSYQRLYLEVPAWVRAHCPPDSVIATLTLSGTFYYYTDFPVLRWDQMGPDDFARYAAALRTSGRPLYAAVLDDEVQPVFTERMPGHWEKLTKIDLCTLWRYRPEP